jgi:hypothetical protein
MRISLLAILLLTAAGCAGAGSGVAGGREGTVVARTCGRAEALNALHNDVNATYGFRDGAPRVNLGPCGRFARDFRERWNARFRDKADIAFVMAGDGSQCHHVLVRLPDGSYYDGGNGVMTSRTLLTLYPDARIEDMTQFDPVLLDRRSYGLARDYPECPNYSDALTRRLIDTHLSRLPADAKR